MCASSSSLGIETDLSPCISPARSSRVQPPQSVRPTSEPPPFAPLPQAPAAMQESTRSLVVQPRVLPAHGWECDNLVNIGLVYPDPDPRQRVRTQLLRRRNSTRSSRDLEHCSRRRVGHAHGLSPETPAGPA